MTTAAKLHQSLSVTAAGSNADHRKPKLHTLVANAGEVDDLLDHQSGLRGLA